MKRRALAAAAGVVIVAVLLSGGYLLYRYLRPVYDLRALHVTAEPKLDGRGGDAVWNNAPELTIPIDQAEPVTIKAVYTKSEIFFQVRYRDATKDGVYGPWVFDGKAWEHGPRADGLLLFFDIGNSIPDFPEKGFGVMDYGFAAVYDIYNFGQLNKGFNKRIWPPGKGRADIWLMGAGNTAPFGIGDDMIYQANQDYLLSPDSSDVQVYPQWDQFNNLKTLNQNSDWWKAGIENSQGLDASKNIKEQPYLVYKEGLNLSNTPYPFEDQLVPMAEDAVFKTGDTLPFVYYDRATRGHWGGSREDVKGTMKWSGGYWTVEMGRKLNTKNLDDIAFRPGESHRVNFGVMVRRDGKVTRYSLPATLELVPQGGE